MENLSQTIEKNEVVKIVSQYLDLSVTPFGEEIRTVVRVDKREAMYNGNGTVYLLQMFGVEELVNNRIGAYMVFLNKDDQAGFHTHGTRFEQELYVVMQGEGEYSDRAGVSGTIRTKKVTKGSITVVDKNGFHSLKNTTNNPLIVFVITTNEPKQ
ncbi:cupin domain-containing protein [Lutibacter sp.]|uniref:cupin domain-containing protein n=1 Tax=Lutibacter sp. TaxID=1925666 RepID=UPI0035613DAD